MLNGHLLSTNPVTPSSLLPYRYVSLLLLLFLVPGIMMMTAYGLISLELYRGIKFEMANRKSSRGTYTKPQPTS